MKYQQNIIFEDGGYVGYLLQNEEVIYFTPKCQTVNVASSKLANYVESAKKGVKPFTEPLKTFVTKQPTVALTVSNGSSNPKITRTSSLNYQPTTKRCCGRG